MFLIFHDFHHPFWGYSIHPPIFGSTPNLTFPETPTIFMARGHTGQFQVEGLAGLRLGYAKSTAQTAKLIAEGDAGEGGKEGTWDHGNLLITNLLLGILVNSP